MLEKIRNFTSPRLENLKKKKKLFLSLTLIFLAAWFITYIFIDWLGYLCLGFSILFGIFYGTILQNIDEEFKILTKNSFLYFKENSFNFLNEVLFNTILTSIAVFWCLFCPDLNKDVANSINITFCSIVFSIYIFILPTTHKFLKEQENKYRKYKKSDKFLELQGLKIYFNSLFGKIIFMITILIISELLYFVKSELFIIFALINFFINVATLIRFIIILYKIYKFDIRELEIDMYNDCIDSGLIKSKRIKKDK